MRYVAAMRVAHVLNVLAIGMALAGCSQGSRAPAEAVPAARVAQLAVGEAQRVTLQTPCGIPPLLVDGVPYETGSYPAPGGNPKGWGATREGTLRRVTEDSYTFRPDEGTIRIQFIKQSVATEIPLPTCNQS
jgi:hypothetical protein